jgi:hypothetical protein
MTHFITNSRSKASEVLYLITILKCNHEYSVAAYTGAKLARRRGKLRSLLHRTETTNEFLIHEGTLQDTQLQACRLCRRGSDRTTNT